MLKERDIFVLNLAVEKGLLSPDEIHDLQGEGQSQGLGLVETLLQKGALTSRQWKRLYNEASHHPHWPQSATQFDRDNREICRRLLQNQFPSNTLDQAMEVVENLQSSGQPHRLDDILVLRGYAQPEELREMLGQTREITCRKCGRSLAVESHDPWHLIPCLFCSHQQLSRDTAPPRVAPPSTNILPVQGKSPQHRTSFLMNVTNPEDEFTPHAPSAFPELEKPPVELDPGQIFGRYKIMEKIGEGGMGAVFKALDLNLSRTVALKVITHRNATDEQYRKRFQKEAKLIAKVSHPYISSLYEVGEIDGLPFLTMAYLKGTDLGREVEMEGPIDEKRALTYIKKVAEAVEFAHEQGVVHRDIKPENIMIDERDEPKLLDFGLAKSLEGGEGTTHMTKTGTVMGSPEFMSPEQALGQKDVSFPTDIYSLGAVLYYLVSGRPPFADADGINLLMMVVEDPHPPLNEVAPQASPAVVTIVHQCLEKDPSHRYPDADSLARDLKKALRGEEITPLEIAPPAKEKVEKKLVALIAASTMIIALLLGMWYFKPQGGPGEQPDSAAVQEHLNQGMTFFEKEQWERATKAFTKALDHNSKLAQAYLYRGYSRRKLKQIQPAIDDFTEALKLDPNNSEPLMHRGYLYYQQNQWKKALQDFLQSQKIDPKKVEAHFLAGEAYFRQGRFNEAVEEYTKTLELEPNEREALFQRGVARYKLSQWNSAFRDFNTYLEANKDHIKSLLYRGKIHYQRKNISQAIGDYKRVLQLAPQNYEAHNLLGKSYLYLNQREKGAREFQKSLDLNSNQAPPHFYLGLIKEQKGQLSQAVECYSKCLQIDENHWKSRYNRGLIRHRRQAHSLAFQDFNRLVQQEPNSAAALFYRGKSQFHLGELKRALKDIKKSLKLHPKNLDGHRYCLSIYQKLGQRDKGFQQLSEVIKHFPRHAPPYLYRGEIQRRRNNHQKAVEDFRKFLQLQPNYPQRQKMFEYINKYGN